MPLFQLEKKKSINDRHALLPSLSQMQRIPDLSELDWNIRPSQSLGIMLK